MFFYKSIYKFMLMLIYPTLQVICNANTYYFVIPV